AVGVKRGLAAGVVLHLVQHRQLGRIAERARRNRQARGLHRGRRLDRRRRGQHRAALAHRDDAERRRKTWRWEDLGAGGAGAAQRRQVGTVAIRAAIGQAVELQLAIGVGALEGQRGAIGWQEAERKVLLDLGVRAFIRNVIAGGGLHLVACHRHRHSAQRRGLAEGFVDRRTDAGGQRIFKVLAHQRAAAIVDGACGVLGAGGGQVGPHRGIECGGVGAEVGALASQRGFNVGIQFDAVGWIAVIIQQLQGQQAVDDLGVLDVGHAGQLQR
ncbi:conserved hypothetical protein, partial [Ricinus communis]